MTTENVWPLRLGILGAGAIATIDTGILSNLHHITEKVTAVAIADPVLERAKKAATDFSIPEIYEDLDTMLERAELDAVINLTPITAHGETSKKILAAGKHLATEKPIATTLEDAHAIIEVAAARNLTVVCSPPNMLYPGCQEARRLIAAGAIGRVAFARVRSSHAGPGGRVSGWPTDPSWFYQEGSGPLFDMGVYGIHEVTGLLGPAIRVVGFSGITDAVRTVRGGPFAGTTIDVTAADNNVFMLDFGESTFAVADGTFNVQAATSPKLEIFGRQGTINVFDRRHQVPLEVYRTEALPNLDGWVVPDSWNHLHQETVVRLGRAILVDHLADCVRTQTEPVLSAAHARHELEIMLKIAESARTGRVVDLETTF